MNCCVECFEDDELVGFVRSNSTQVDNCDYCSGENVKLVDPREFEAMFSPLLDGYKHVEDDADSEYSPSLLHEKLQDDWTLFSKSLIDNENHQKLLIDIFDNSDKSSDWFSELVEQKVLVEQTVDTKKLETWNKFRSEIKTNNRYFLGNKIDLDVLEELFEYHSDDYDKGKIFYRARVSNKDGHAKDKMGSPPPKKASSGRANPIGIPYLYVATEKETVKYECRANHLDYITIADFKLKENIKVVSLREIENISPFLIGEKLEKYLKNQKYLKTLEDELSKPLREDDQKLDYLPTQYICEYIKSLGYDAIEYGSSLNDGGRNLAIFDDKKAEIIKTEVHEVTSMELEIEPLTA